jgi:hypothetical protein
VWRCRSCRRTTTREAPHRRCIAWRCDGLVEWVPEDEDSYDLQLLDGAYSMLRSEEHTAMVPADERERLENLFKGDSEAVNCLVCTPTLELGIDIGRLDSVLMRKVPPLPANYRQRAGRAGRRHRMAVDLTYCRPVSHDRAYFAEPLKLLDGRIDAPAFNLRNDVMVAKHVHATVIGALHGYGRDAARPEGERAAIRDVLHRCLPRRVEPYLFEDGEVRGAPFDFGALRDLVQRHAADLADRVQAVFRQGWPAEDAGVATSTALGAHVDAFTDNLEHVVARLRSRLQWAMRQIARLNALRERHGTLEPDDEALFRRCDRLVKRLKGTDRRSRRQAEGHDDVNTFSVLAAEGFLPGYGLEVGSVVGWAEIPFWRTGAMDFSLPRPPATALREYVPGNLIYANGHRFVARRFRRDLHGATGTGSRTGGDLQVLVIGHVDRDDVDALLWDPMPGGSGLLDQLCERFQEVVQAAREVAGACPGRCASSCIDCLQSRRRGRCGAACSWPRSSDTPWSRPSRTARTVCSQAPLPARARAGHCLSSCAMGSIPIPASDSP